MTFTVGQNVNVTNNGVVRAGTIVRLGPLGSKDSYVVRYNDNNTQQAFFGASISQISSA